MITPELMQANARAAVSATQDEGLRNVLGFFTEGLERTSKGMVRGSEVEFDAQERLAKTVLDSLGISTVNGQWMGAGAYERHSFEVTSYLGGALSAMAQAHPLTGLKTLGINNYRFASDTSGTIIARKQHANTYQRSTMAYMLTTTGASHEGTLAVELSLEIPITRNATLYGNLATAVFDPKNIKNLRNTMRSSEVIAQSVPMVEEYLGSLVMPKFFIRIGELNGGHGLQGWPTLRPTYRIASILDNGKLIRHRHHAVPNWYR